MTPQFGQDVHKEIDLTIEPRLRKGVWKNHAELLETVKVPENCALRVQKNCASPHQNVRLVDEMLIWNEAALEENRFLVLHVHEAC